MRIALRFWYDGAAFPRGYARQPEGGTVEDTLLVALRRHGYVDGSWRTGSRTDRGVSATENLAACEVDRPHIDGLVPALNSELPDSVGVLSVGEVDEDWNPRHGTRTYLYFAPRQGEDIHAMEQACHAFIGEHDFSAFARIEERSPVRRVHAFGVAGDGMWTFTCRADGFLWNQVRRMVDAVLAVGRGDATPEDVKASLESGVPHGSFKLAARDGLLLAGVKPSRAVEWSEAAGAGRPPPTMAQRAAVLARLAHARSQRQ